MTISYTYKRTRDETTGVETVTYDAATLPIVDPVDVDGLFPLWFAKVIDPLNAIKMSVAYDAVQVEKRYITPGGRPIADAKGGVIACHLDGSVWRNGIRLGATFAQLVLSYGDGLFMKGKTDGRWWSWSGTSWGALTGVATLDPLIFV